MGKYSKGGQCHVNTNEQRHGVVGTNTQGGKNTHGCSLALCPYAQGHIRRGDIGARVEPALLSP